jgi:hypothetical protein
VGAENFAFGLLGAGISRGGTALGNHLVDTRLSGLVSPELGRAGVQVVVGGVDSATSDALSQLSQTGEIDGGRVLLAGLSGMGTTAALGHASTLAEQEARRAWAATQMPGGEAAFTEPPGGPPSGSDPAPPAGNEVSGDAQPPAETVGPTFLDPTAAAIPLAALAEALGSGTASPPTPVTGDTHSATQTPALAPGGSPPRSPTEPPVERPLVPPNPEADPRLPPPPPITDLRSFLASLGSGGEERLIQGGFNPEVWGVRDLDGVAYPPRASGITPDMQKAVLEGLRAYAEATGIVITGVGTRESDPDGTFWHSVDNAQGGPAYESKPGSTVGIPDQGLLLQGELGASQWGVVHSESEHVINPQAAAEIAALEAQAGGDPVKLQALLDEANRRNLAQGDVARYVIHEGEVIQLRRYVSDLDIAYLAGPDGRPITDDGQILEIGRYINDAYRAMGYTITLVNHGAHFNGMRNPEYNRAFGLTWKYQDRPVYNFTPEGYRGTTRLLDTFKYLYNEPDWPVVPAERRADRADQYQVYVPTADDPRWPASPPPSEEGMEEAPADTGYRQMPLELDATGLPWEGWESGPLPPSARAVLRAEATQPSRPASPDARPAGRPAVITAAMDEVKREALRLQNQAAEVLARAGYLVEQRGEAPGPDYLVEGRSFECLAPAAPRPDSVWDQIKEKVLEGNHRIVLHLGRARVDPAALKQVLESYPIRGLKEVLIVTPQGGLAQFWP